MKCRESLSKQKVQFHSSATTLPCTLHFFPFRTRGSVSQTQIRFKCTIMDEVNSSALKSSSFKVEVEDSALVIQIEYLVPKAHITFCVHLILTPSFVSCFDQSVQKCLSIKN